tara:strand:+ start:636 stop:1028 length:393 start_codon:yes stop_codon:yes gene_type:complete
MATWQLSWNTKNYNASGRMLAAAASESGKNMIQSWGRTSTRNIDKVKVGDTMYISCQKKCIGKATVTQAFEQTDKIVTDEFSINQTENHHRHENRWYCHIHIDEIYFDNHQKDLRGNQNTICNPSDPFWK